MKKPFLIFLFIIICLMNSVIVFANEQYFEMEEVDDPKYNSIDLFESEKLSYSIQTFDVSKEGNIAVGMSEYIICIYNKDLEFQHCFQLDQDGAYYLKWDLDGNLLVCFTRYNTIVKVKMTGEIVGIYRIIDTKKNNQLVLKLDKKSKQIDNEIFKMKTQGYNGYTYLIKVDKNGNETIIIDTSKLMKYEIIKIVIIAFIIVTIFLTLFIKLLKYRDLLNKGKDTDLGKFISSIFNNSQKR